MQVIKTPIEGLLIIKTDIFKDNRGCFSEIYSKPKFSVIGINDEFVQDNLSESIHGTIRGLHAQHNPSQSKLVACLSGAIYDVAVDVRSSSATYGKYFGLELSKENGQLLYIPAGFLHGFCAISKEPALVNYKVSGAYNKDGEVGVRFDDPDIAINWPNVQAILSEKDQVLPRLQEIKEKLPW